MGELLQIVEQISWYNTGDCAMAWLGVEPLPSASNCAYQYNQSARIGLYFNYQSVLSGASYLTGKTRPSLIRDCLLCTLQVSLNRQTTASRC
jgi:hypothetical protein